MRTTQLGPWLVACAVMLAAVGCGGDVTGTDEYLALEADLVDTVNQLQISQAAEEQLRAELEQAQAELEQAQVDLASADQDVLTWRSRTRVAEAALEAELNRPWPENFKSYFVEGCAQDPVEPLSAEEYRNVCSCIVDRIEPTMSLGEFMYVSAAMEDPLAEVDPMTGLPTDLSEESVGSFMTAITICTMGVEVEN